MANIKVQKESQIKTIPAEHKSFYINAGWGEVKEPTNVGASSSKTNDGYNKN